MGTQSFIRFTTEDRILEILIKERVKWIGKEKEAREKSDVFKRICELLPAQRTWVTPGKKHRSHLNNERTRHLKNNANALRKTIDRDRTGVIEGQEGKKDRSRPGYLPKLYRFVADIMETVATGDVTLVPPTTTALFKEEKSLEDRVVVTFRPISVYEDLKTKVLVKLASEYLTRLLDPLFHEEILSYRTRRDYHGEHPKELYMTKADDAVPNILKFKKEHETVWVAECDIKKFYDIVNHRCVMESLERLLEKGHIDRKRAAGAIEILKAYLDGYNFKESVLGKSREPGFWDPYLPGLGKKLKPGKKKIECQFGWVDERELGDDLRQVGIPQGGVLSTLICNILMNDVDQAVVDPNDPDRFFNRFGDDILLMHATEEGCRRLFEAYKASLTAHKLIYHDEKTIGDNYKDGRLTRADYWNEKTKAPFLWGPGEGNAAEWIGFVGYEIRYDGEVRLRKSTLKKQFNKICFQFHKATHIDTIKSGVANCMKGLDKCAWSILKFEQLDFNPASRRQMHHLDRYRHNKRNKALLYLSTLPQEKAKEQKEAPKGPASYASLLAGRKRGR